MNIKMEFYPDIILLESQYVALIRKRLGISIQSHQSYELFKTIQESCIKFECTPSEYLQKITDCPDKSPLLEQLIAGITIGETYFFRDQQQMQLLQHYILPELIKNKREHNEFSIRIWSAGCASGEEIYSIAMMLYELLPDINEWTLNLLATDINTHVLQKALIGSYSNWSMRSISDYFKQKYFIQEDNRFLLVKKIRELVNFDYLNLNDDSYPSIFNGTNAQDLIICRNVFIYLGNESLHQLMPRLNHSIVRGGYLMLGASDPIDISDTDFIFHYRKGLLFSRPLQETPKNVKVTEIIRPKFKIISTITKEKRRATVLPDKIFCQTENRDLIAKATELANLGKLDEAVKLCEKSFKSDPTNKLNYFTYGLALSELNKFPEAEAALRKTLFLDNQFVAGHFQLGLLLLRKNKHAAGLKCLKNALAIAESKQPDDAVVGSPGLSYQRLVEILKNEINLHVPIGT